MIYIIPPILLYLLIISFGIKLGFFIYFCLQSLFSIGVVLKEYDFKFLVYTFIIFIGTIGITNNTLIEKRNIIIKEKHIIYKGISTHIKENCYNDFYTIYLTKDTIFNQEELYLKIKCFKKEIK